jgi:hypothetical protein
MPFPVRGKRHFCLFCKIVCAQPDTHAALVVLLLGPFGETQALGPLLATLPHSLLGAEFECPDDPSSRAATTNSQTSISGL